MDLRAKLGWSYSCALTSGSWRHRWRWPGSSRRVGSQIASMRGSACAIGSPGSAARRRVCRILGGRGALSWRPKYHRRCRRHEGWVVPGRWREDSRLRGRASGLTDRRAECGVLDQLIDAVRAGGSRVLVVRGEPGVGKSALLDYLAGQAAGCRVVRAAGVESEMELAFAGLHQLLAPVLDRAGAAAGAAAGGAADRVRPQRRPGAGPVPGGPGGAGAAVGGGRRAAAGLRGR